MNFFANIFSGKDKGIGTSIVIGVVIVGVVVAGVGYYLTKDSTGTKSGEGGDLTCPNIEIFVDNYRVISSEHIKNIEKSEWGEEWRAIAKLTDEGKERFADYTGRKQNIPDKAGHPGVFYIDRPSNAVILFREDLLDTIKKETANLRIDQVAYSQSTHKFKYKTTDSPQTELDESHWFYLQVPTIPIKNNQIPQKHENYIQTLVDEGKINRVILLGKKKNFTNLSKNDNLILDNKTILPFENITRQNNKNETTIEWFHKIMGLDSWPILKSSITGNAENLDAGLSVITGSKKEVERLDECY